MLLILGRTDIIFEIVMCMCSSLPQGHLLCPTARSRPARCAVPPVSTLVPLLYGPPLSLLWGRDLKSARREHVLHRGALLISLFVKEQPEGRWRKWRLGRRNGSKLEKKAQSRYLQARKRKLDATYVDKALLYAHECVRRFLEDQATKKEYAMKKCYITFIKQPYRVKREMLY